MFDEYNYIKIKASYKKLQIFLISKLVTKSIKSPNFYSINSIFNLTKI